MTPKTYKIVMTLIAIALLASVFAAGKAMQPVVGDYKRLKKVIECGDNNKRECL